MIELKNVFLKAGSFTLNDISIEIPSGSYAILMGRTGCGKTSLLEAIIGLKSVSSGTILLCGEDVTHIRPSGRGVGYVPQDRALFPTMTIREHLAFALEIRHENTESISERVHYLAEELGISHLLDRKPQGLSGGEAQRVALGRALSFRPEILCLDEPLSAVDEAMRDDLCELLKRVQRETQTTVLHVTHNLSEAEKIADEIYILENGIIRKHRG